MQKLCAARNRRIGRTMSKTNRTDPVPEPTSGPDSDGYRLTSSFPYLVRRVGLRIGELFDRAVAPHGVDVSMYRVMAALVERDGQQLGQLARIATIELSTLSRLVGTMAGKGLLTRRRPRGNGRIVEISLSVKGRRLVEDLMPVAAHFERVATQGLTAAELKQQKAMLEAAFTNLDQLEAELQQRDTSTPDRPTPRRPGRPATAP